MTLADIKIKSIVGVEFDKIVGFTADLEMATIAYEFHGSKRTVSVESDSVLIERQVVDDGS